MKMRHPRTRRRHKKIERIFQDFVNATEFEKMSELVDYCKRFGNLKETELEPDEESASESEE